MSHRNFTEIIQAKLKTSEQIIRVKTILHDEGKCVAFTNGCFDILHRGHLEYLAKSAELADYLVVGLNSDSSVRAQNKSPERPINNEITRAMNLASLLFVDAVIIFDEQNPFRLINKILPDVLIKGGDYDAQEENSASKKYIIGSDIVKNAGGRVVTIPLVQGYSTTSIIEKMRKQ